MAATFKGMDAARNSQRQSTLPEGRPAHFFKIVLPTAIIDKKLRLPVKFVEDYGNDLNDIVTLCDPNCREWQVGLEKSGDNVWFCVGWESFADFYSITTEFLLVFRYEGYSKFHVLIFDTSGSEIQYPRNDSNCNTRVEEDEEGSLKSLENDHDYDCDDADYDNNDKDGDYGVEPDDSEDNETEDNDFADYESSSPSQSPSNFRPRGRIFTKFIDRASKWPPKSSSQRRRKRHRSHVYESDQSDLLGEDNQTEDNDFVDYESSSPSQSPSYFRPRGRGFTKFIDRASKWPPKSSSQRKRKRHESCVYESDQRDSQGEDIKVASNHRTATSSKHHDYDNNDKDGDYGVEFDDSEDNQTEDNDFVDYDSSSPSQSHSHFRPRGRGFTKFIDRASKWPKKSSSQRKRKRHESSAYESDQSDSQCEDIKVVSNHRTPKSTKQHSGYGFKFKEVEHTQWRCNAKSRSRHNRGKRVSTKENDKVFRAAQKYKSKFPSFLGEVRGHNVYNKYMYVPADFGSKYLDSRPELIKLETLDGKQWPVRCFCKSGSGNGRTIGKGWAKFFYDNDLQKGDVCLFELIHTRKIVLKVRIFRVDEYARR